MKPCLFLYLGIALGTIAAAADAWREVPSQWAGPLITIPVQVGGDPDRTLRLLLDTGATHTVIDPESLLRVSEADLEPGEFFTLSRLDIAGVKFTGNPALLQDLDHIAAALGGPIDGILGYPTLRPVSLRIDYPKQQVALAVDAAPLPRDSATVRLKRNRRRPWIDLEVAGRRRPVLIDSGSSQGFSLQPHRRLGWRETPRQVSELVGFTAREAVIVGRLESDLQLGGTRFVTPVARRLEPTDIPSIGGEVLRHFVVTFDGPRRRIHFAPGTVGESHIVPPEAMRGLGVGWHRLPDQLAVGFLMANGPGETAGLKIGDRVRAIDGVPVAEAISMDSPLRGREHLTLSVERDGRETPLTIELRRGVLVP